MERRLHVMHCSSEVFPFSKTGGLADVSAALPRALAGLGHEVVVVTPFYGSTDREALGVEPTGHCLEVTLGGRTETFQVYESTLSEEGPKVYLLENQGFFDRPFLYGTKEGDYEDNHLRFAFFSAAIFRLLRVLRLVPNVIHCHDWQTGLVPAYNVFKLWRLTSTVFTIHNLV